jgi:hypothetical protein
LFGEIFALDGLAANVGAACHNTVAASADETAMAFRWCLMQPS